MDELLPLVLQLTNAEQVNKPLADQKIVVVCVLT